MSWENAEKEVRYWIDGLNLPTAILRGKSLDLSKEAGALRFEPKFRVMVIRTARRLLPSRDVHTIIPE